MQRAKIRLGPLACMQTIPLDLPKVVKIRESSVCKVIIGSRQL